MSAEDYRQGSEKIHRRDRGDRGEKTEKSRQFKDVGENGGGRASGGGSIPRERIGIGPAPQVAAEGHRSGVECPSPSARSPLALPPLRARDSPSLPSATADPILRLCVSLCALRGLRGQIPSSLRIHDLLTRPASGSGLLDGAETR